MVNHEYNVTNLINPGATNAVAILVTRRVVAATIFLLHCRLES